MLNRQYEQLQSNGGTEFMPLPPRFQPTSEVITISSPTTNEPPDTETCVKFECPSVIGSPQASCPVEMESSCSSVALFEEHDTNIDAPLADDTRASPIQIGNYSTLNVLNGAVLPHQLIRIDLDSGPNRRQSRCFFIFKSNGFVHGAIRSCGTGSTGLDRLYLKCVNKRNKHAPCQWSGRLIEFEKRGIHHPQFTDIDNFTMLYRDTSVHNSLCLILSYIRSVYDLPPSTMYGSLSPQAQKAFSHFEQKAAKKELPSLVSTADVAKLLASSGYANLIHDHLRSFRAPEPDTADTTDDSVSLSPVLQTSKRPRFT